QCRVAEQWDVNVGGVYRDFPTNSQMNNDVYQCLSEQQRGELWSNNSQWFHFLFVKLRKGAEGERISEELLANSPKLRETSSHFTFLTLSEVYYVQNEAYNSHLGSSEYSFGKRNGNRILVWAYALVALLVMVIAAINYVNFSMAMVPYQIKEVNVRRIFGAKVSSLRLNMMKAAIANVFVAAVLAILLLKVIIQLGFLNGLQNCDLAFAANGGTLLMMLILVVVLPVVAGAYPAWYLTTRKPALVISGNFALSPKGREFRRGLIAFQFTISIVILQVLLLFSAQQHYVRTAPVGYDRDSVLYVEASKEYEQSMADFKWKDYIEPMMHALKTNPLVSEVSWTGALLGQDMFTLNAINFGERMIAFNLLEVGDNFLTTMGIDVVEGRNFHEGEKNAVIFNEAARKQLDLKLNDKIVFSGGVIGFVEDFHYKSFREKITPMAFGVTENVGNKLVIRLTSPERSNEVVRFIKEQNQNISGGRCELTFYTPDKMFGSTYSSEMKQMKLLLMGAIISLLIPLIGVFGLVLFETRAKRKEIGIRKVFGATTRGILVIFNWQYIRILIACFIVAAPVAYSLYERWIESFAYRTPMHWWLFGVAFLIVALVVCLTVTIQSWRAARERPVDTIMK
ncbi:MAG: FtsX-like permease family protein, partial [Bacteroidaceae bacterium]|nr:FtsX-like permease family protein [Bacteroidaceae bacterium]